MRGRFLSIMSAAVAAVLHSTPGRASIDCEALKTGTAPFQLTSEEVLTKEGKSKTLTIISQVYRGPDGINTELSSLPGRQRKAKSRFGIDYDLRMAMASGRSLRIETSNLPEKDLLGQKRDFSLEKKVRTTTNNSEIMIDEKYTFKGDGNITLGSCMFPVLSYTTESTGMLATHSDFAYAPSLRLKLRWKEVTQVNTTELRAIGLVTSFDPLPEPKD